MTQCSQISLHLCPDAMAMLKCRCPWTGIRDMHTSRERYFRSGATLRRLLPCLQPPDSNTNGHKPVLLWVEGGTDI